MMTVEDRLKMMFVENTGMHICDSGGADGRKWQMNQKNHPMNQPEVEFDGDWGFSVNAYHHLKECLYTDELCDRFNALNEGSDNLYREEYSDLMERVSSPVLFTREAYNLLDSRITKVERSYYTYNFDCVLDHDMIVSHLSAIDDLGYEVDYVLINLHLGCDARGGFGTAFLFKVDRYESVNLCCPTVWGTVKRGDEELQVSNDYDGINLTLDDGDGEEYEYQEGDIVELSVYHG